MSHQFTRRDFAIRTAGLGLAMGLAPAVPLAQAEQATRPETSPAIADPYSVVDPELVPTLKQFPAYDLSHGHGRKVPANAWHAAFACSRAAARGAAHPRPARSTRGSSMDCRSCAVAEK